MTRIKITTCMVINGGTERQMSVVVISGGATPLIKIKDQPKGGVK